MKKICFFIGDVTRSGGTERVTLQIAGELAKNNAEYCIYISSLMEASDISFYDIPGNIRRHRILSNKIEPINRAAILFFVIVFRLVRFIKREKIDIIVDVDGILDVFSIPAKLFTKFKVVTWEHFNFYANLDSVFRPYVKKMSARFSDYIIVITEEDRGYYQQNLKLRAPVDFIYNPVNMEYEANYNADSKKILSAGRLTSQKGFDMLLDAAKIVLEKHNDWVWTIAGEGEERESLEAKIQELGLSGRVQLVGNVTNIEDYYATAGMFVLTSRFEGFGLVIAEAKVHRLPVVSFACKAGPKELVMDGHNGFLIECFDVDDMANKILKLIEDKKLRMRFSNNSGDEMEKFCYSFVIRKWEYIFDFLLQEKKTKCSD